MEKKNSKNPPTFKNKKNHTAGIPFVFLAQNMNYIRCKVLEKVFFT